MWLFALVLLGSRGVFGENLTNVDTSSLKERRSCSCISGFLKAKTEISAPVAFMKFGISPTYLPVPPKDKLRGNFATANVELGNFIDPLRTIDPVDIEYPNRKNSVNYTLILFDIDGSQEPPPNAFLVGLYLNVPNGKNLLDGGGDIAVPFVPPMPNLGSGVHRPAAILYEQNEHIDPDQIDLLKLAKTRTIQLAKFAESYNLHPKPVAGIFYTTELRRCGKN